MVGADCVAIEIVQAGVETGVFNGIYRRIDFENYITSDLTPKTLSFKNLNFIVGWILNNEHPDFGMSGAIFCCLDQCSLSLAKGPVHWRETSAQLRFDQQTEWEGLFNAGAQYSLVITCQTSLSPSPPPSLSPTRTVPAPTVSPITISGLFFCFPL